MRPRFRSLFIYGEVDFIYYLGYKNIDSNNMISLNSDSKEDEYCSLYWDLPEKENFGKGYNCVAKELKFNTKYETGI